MRHPVNSRALGLSLGAACLVAACLGPLPLAAQGAPAQSNEGFLYGTVETRSGKTYRGILRWNDEESFWDDLFNSGKEDLDHWRHVPRQDRRQDKTIEIFGIKIGYSWHEDHVSRLFVARFGDIRSIRVVGRAGAELTMKSGEVYRVEGHANDVGESITVRDPAVGAIELDWSAIERITFAATPRDARPPARRIYGILDSEAGTFEGFIQWDSQECLSTDELDGETEDGDASIPMGRIRAIEKRNRRGAWVELEDGRRLLLEDTNDVDDSIRGIFVEDERYGRVEVGWDSFRRVDFKPSRSSGRGYDDYPPLGELRGTVTDRKGRKHSGRLVYDLDEAEGWELLNGDTYDVELYVPFARVRSVIPRSSRSSEVVFVGGRKIHLEDRTDVDEDNAGILIFVAGEDQPRYVPWSEVDRVDFDHD